MVGSLNQSSFLKRALPSHLLSFKSLRENNIIIRDNSTATFEKSLLRNLKKFSLSENFKKIV